MLSHIQPPYTCPGLLLELGSYNNEPSGSIFSHHKYLLNGGLSHCLVVILLLLLSLCFPLYSGLKGIGCFIHQSPCPLLLFLRFPRDFTSEHVNQSWSQALEPSSMAVCTFLAVQSGTVGFPPYPALPLVCQP